MAQLAGVRGLSEGRIREARRAKFGSALAEALRVRRWSQADLAQKMGTTQSAVSAWITGKSLPVADDVFEIEIEMDMTAGSLSRHLGYLPIGADTAPPDVEVAIAANPDLDPEAKDMMLSLFRKLRVMCRQQAALTSVKTSTNGSKAKAATPARSSRAGQPRSR